LSQDKKSIRLTGLEGAHQPTDATVLQKPGDG
jgi:hypothetical protein